MTNPYFNQSKAWVNFWRNSNDSKHDIHYFENEDLSVYVYQYPLFAGFKFWYIPRAFILKNNNISTENALGLLKQIEESAIKNGIVYIKIDINDLPELNGIGGVLEIAGYRYSPRKIQYLKTKILDLTDLKHENSHKEENPNIINCQDLVSFWDQNQKIFTKLMDKRTRYGVRKGLQIPFTIDTAKNDQNFINFVNLHFSTANRQHFTPFPVEYLKKMFDQDFCHILTLHGDDNIAHCSWMGVCLDGVIYHIFGGSDSYARENYSQYLMHLAVIYNFQSNGFNKYDLGGLEDGKGYDMFKAGFNGFIVQFTGPFDKPLNKLVFNLYNFIRLVRNRIK